MLRDLWRDAVRACRADRWTSVTIVATLAAGTGFNAAVLALGYGILFRPLPYADADRLVVIEQEINRLAESGPTEEELARSKSYLKGSYALGFDTSAKIAGQLVQIQLVELGIDYIDRRNGLIEAVTIEDVRRVAKRLLDSGLLVTVVGRPQGVKDQGG